MKGRIVIFFTLMLVMTVRAELVEEFHLTAVGDVNGDGQITIADVTDLVNVILGKE